MLKKILFSIIIFYTLTLLQTSFFVHFPILGIIPNYILILVIFWNFFEKPNSSFGLYNAALGGLFIDIFSSRPIGFYILILLSLAILIKLIFKRYVQLPFIERT